MDLFDTIKKDHEEFKKLFKKLAEKQTRGDYSRLHRDIVAHMTAEERTLYPALQETEARQLALEAIEEHNAAKHELQQIDQLSFDDEHWLPKFMVMRDLVLHHIEMEESKVFQHSKKLFDEKKLSTLQKEFSAARKETLAPAGKK